MPIILNGTTGITTPGITNTGPFVFQGVVELPAGAVGAPSLTTTGDTNTGIYFPAANQVAIATDGAQRVLVDATGNVGVGVAPSAWEAASQRAIQAGAGAFFVGTTTQTQMLVGANFYYDGTNVKYIGTGQATYYQQNAGVHSWYTAASGTAGNNVTFTQAMMLDASGQLLVGNTAQNGIQSRGYFRQEADGDWRGVSIVSAAANQFVGGLYIDSSGNFNIAQSYLGASSYQAITFRTSGTERARITAAGDFLIGGTTAESKLNVYSGGSTFSSGTMPAGMTIYGATTDGQGSMLSFKATSGDQGIAGIAGVRSSGYQTELRFYTNNTNSQNAFNERARLTAAGELCIQRTTPTFSSNNRGNITIGGTDSSILFLGTGNGTGSYVFHEQSVAGMEVWNTANGYIRFGTNATERARITATGDFGIGTSSPSYKLHVNGPAAVIGMARTGIDGRYQHGVYNWFTTSGSAYVHFKTNLKLQSPSANVGMWNIKIYGYSYGSSKTVETYYCLHGDGSGNIYSPAVQNVGQVAFGVAMYKSSDGYLVIPGLMDSVYFFGVMIDCLHLMGYTVFDFAITNVAQSASPTGAF